MQIHDLNTKALTNPAYVAFDDGTDTYKADFKAEIDNAAADAVADADLTDNTVAFTSGDSSSPIEWTAVDVLTSGLPIKTLFNRISTMIKNVRWLYSKLGTTDISSIGEGTVTGAISSLNSKFESGTWTPTIKRANISNATGKWRKIDNMVWCSGSVTFSNTQTNQGNIYLDEFSLPIRGGENRGAIGWGTIDTVGDLLIGAAIGNRNAWISVNGTRISATKQGVANSTMQFVICYTM